MVHSCTLHCIKSTNIFICRARTPIFNLTTSLKRYPWNFFFQVRLDTESRGIFSRRGILAEFWPIGCATLREPSFGYRHMRNFSHATYACTEGYVFQVYGQILVFYFSHWFSQYNWTYFFNLILQDSLEKTRTLECNTVKGQWTDHLVNCISLQYLRWVLPLLYSRL